MTWELFAVFLGSSIRLATPLLLAGIGEMVSERAGVLNMSIEGMMLMSAFAAAVGAWATGDPLVGLLIGIISVVPVSLLQAFLSNTLRANQIVSGIGINILVLGATTLAYREIFGARSRAEIPGLAKVKPPLLGDIPGIGNAVFQQVWLLYAGIALIAITALVLRYTSLGLAIHVVEAVDVFLGINALRPPRHREQEHQTLRCELLFHGGFRRFGLKSLFKFL